MRELLCDDFRFNGKISPALTASVVDGPWAKADTSSAGSPTVASAGGFMDLTLASTSEVENLCLYFGDVLPYDIDDLVQFDVWLKITATLDAAISAAFGLASARNDDIDTLAHAALFRVIGSNSVVVESDDGVNNNDDVATGLSLSTTLKRFSINFKDGIQTVSGGLSTGGKSNVLFYAENDQQLLRPVGRGTRFNMENYSGGLQPYFQLKKTAAAAVATLSIKRVRVMYRG